MLQSENLVPLSDIERQLFGQLVPEDHFLRRLLQVVDFERFRPVLAPAYCQDDGRPPLDPVFMLKLEVLALHYRLSDRALMKQAQVNVAPRLFLGLNGLFSRNPTGVRGQNTIDAATRSRWPYPDRASLRDCG